MVNRIPAKVFMCLSALCATYLAAGEPELRPPEQDYYLHFDQELQLHEIAWVESPGDLIVRDALTVEAWVY